MSTAVRTPAETVATARAVLCTVNELPWPQDRDKRRPLSLALITLGDCIDLYECLESGLIHWESQYPELLECAAMDAAEAAQALIEAAACCGEVAAVSGSEGGTE